MKENTEKFLIILFQAFIGIGVSATGVIHNIFSFLAKDDYFSFICQGQLIFIFDKLIVFSACTNKMIFLSFSGKSYANIGLVIANVALVFPTGQQLMGCIVPSPLVPQIVLIVLQHLFLAICHSCLPGSLFPAAPLERLCLLLVPCTLLLAQRCASN